MRSNVRRFRVNSAGLTLCQPLPVFPIIGHRQTGAAGPFCATKDIPSRWFVCEPDAYLGLLESIDLVLSL
jgi:hypothetical protein